MSRSRGAGGSNWLVGCDLGKRADHTAVVILEQFPSDGQVHYRAHQIEHVPLGTPYTLIADWLRRVLSADLPDPSRSRLVIDRGQVGEAVAEQITAGPLRQRVITMQSTGGQRPSLLSDGARPGELITWSVPKLDLAGALVVVLEQRRLHIDPALDQAETLLGELEGYEARQTRTGGDTVEGRHGLHDDLVTALALPIWWAEHQEQHRRPPLRWQTPTGRALARLHYPQPLFLRTNRTDESTGLPLLERANRRPTPRRPEFRPRPRR